MAYDKQDKCAGCGISIPAVHEDADGDAALRDTCYRGADIEIPLYYHKTDGGAEYLTDSYVQAPAGHKEGTFQGARFCVRIDGDIRRDAALKYTPREIRELQHPPDTIYATLEMLRRLKPRAQGATSEGACETSGLKKKR